MHGHGVLIVSCGRINRSRAAVLKYADAVLSGYATAISVLLTGVLSMVLFGTELRRSTAALGMTNVLRGGVPLQRPGRSRSTRRPSPSSLTGVLSMVLFG